MVECHQCDNGIIEKIQTPYGCKEVCDTCGHVAKDVDTYAGVMVWSHKTAPEIEIHTSKASAQAVLESSRSRSTHKSVHVRHHAPQEMGGRRQNNSRIKNTAHRAINFEARQNQAVNQRSIVIPPALGTHVWKMVKGDPTSLQAFTSFTANDVKKVIAVLPHTSSMSELCQSLGLRAGKQKKPVGILSWLSSFGHAEPPAKIEVWQDGEQLVLKSTGFAHSKNSQSALDTETIRLLGYKSATSRYN